MIYDRYKAEILVSGSSVFSHEVEIRVTSDGVVPTVQGFALVPRSTLRATVTFSELMDPVTAAAVGNYVFTGGPGVASATLQADGKSVVLGVTGLCENSSYSLRISGAKDLAGNTMVTTNLTVSIGFFQLNLALGGVASSSSTGFGAPPQNANDGNTDGNYGNGSIFHSADNAPEADRYWQVDLLTEQPIGRLSYWRRTDCCGERDSNYSLVIYDGADPSTKSTGCSIRACRR